MATVRIKQVAALAASVLLFGTAIGAFWYQDWQYSLPTPKPEGLEQPTVGSVIDVEALLGQGFEGRLVAIHVVNPDCPCSIFNRDHLRTLVKRFGDRMTFVALVQGSEDTQALERRFAAWDIPMSVVADPGGRRAAALGAYSTPQAVIVSPDRRLYFRGNYNRTRYHADPRTEFARIAVEAALAGMQLPAMPLDATVAYGCPFPHRTASLQLPSKES